MKTICLLRNPIQEYAWGSTTAIPDLLGIQNPDDTPQAELWMGAHPKAPSQVNYEGHWVALPELIQAHPIDILGNQTAVKFSNRLPYLFKVLAAAKPLSIQAHPSLEQAQRGFQRENELNISLSAPNRNYKDANHKPECLCALTSFWALCGFRKCREILELIEKLELQQLNPEMDEFRSQPDADGLKAFLTALMTMADPRKQSVVTEAKEKAARAEKKNAEFEWMIRLSQEYPNDIGIFSPILLNLINLRPGQAFFVPAGDLHAYLEGVGMELMANSDNVLRGGLTPKHVDASELLSILNFNSRTVIIQDPDANEDNERIYHGDAAEYVLSMVRLPNDGTYRSSEDRSVEILFCTEGEAAIAGGEAGKSIRFSKGTSVLVPAAVEIYSIKGGCTFYKASVPL